MNPKVCEHHGEIAYKVERLNIRMDRIELGIVGCLFMLVAALWMLWDLPGQIGSNKQQDKRAGIVQSAQAEAK